MSANAGTLVIAPVRPPSSADRFPVAYADELAGGHHQVATRADRDAIPSERLIAGMLCYVLADGSGWRWLAGVWREEQAGDLLHEFRGAQPLVAGSPVVAHPGGYGVLIGDAGDAVPAIGLAVTDAVTGFTVPVRAGGRLALADWTAVLGVADLPARARVYLASGGGLALTPPTVAGCLVQFIGAAVTSRMLALSLDPTPIRRS